MSIDDAVLSVIGLLYDASLDEDLWPVAVERLVELGGGRAGLLDIVNRQTAAHDVAVSVNFDRSKLDAATRQLVKSDPRRAYVRKHPEKRIYWDYMYIAEGEMDAHRYYRWEEANAGTRYHISGVSAVGAGPWSRPGPRAEIVICRTRERGHVSAREIELFQFLFPHIERSIGLGLRLGDLRGLRASMRDLLDRNPTPVLLLDHAGMVVFVNSAMARLAEAEADEDGGLRLTDTLDLAHPVENRRLRQLIGDAAATHQGGVGRGGGAMTVSRSAEKLPLHILVSALPARRTSLAAAWPAVAVFVSDPEQKCRLTAAHLQVRLGLTPAEARLAAELAAGLDLRAAARLHGTSYHTVRRQLAAIFEKTYTKRQSELVALLLRLDLAG